MSDTIDIKRAAASIAKMVDEFTERGWNDEGRANFATIVERRLRRFRIEAEYERILKEYGEEAARHVMAAIDDALAKGGRRSLGSTDFDPERMVQVVTVSIPSMHYRFYVAPDLLDMHRR